ncbi:hypothetical protein RF11_12080 [Thelohanellus kitauei]|uniref:DUF7041 domain-containing protein n=1 Tax=Thelohanellus kitauei TaxID=669202 RepID=A0A0C2N988_THEKT|nr:hypothetical protein RF11_07377 [Thelohanellus kitauei]KII70487.1 hypothetical protein RF11_11822 [Thelohanellus kitauei]KII74097.1 hypothetical protein RF11_12080 [Thelohanellus kitauei]
MEEISAISHANAVAIKLPTFWTAQPRVWFVQTEAQFHLRGIVSDTTKYYYVVGALDQETAGRMIDTLSKPPLEGKYENLKSKLLSAGPGLQTSRHDGPRRSEAICSSL